MITTGYFANEKTWTKVHYVENGKPICNSRIVNKDYKFCANGRYAEYIECKKCKNKKLKL